MNKVYLYDGNFYSLLSLILTLLKFKKEPLDIKSEDDYEPNLLDEPIFLKIDKKESVNNIEPDLIFRIYYVYLSNNNNKEMIIYNFVKEYFIHGKDVIYRRNIESVNQVIKISNYVSREGHKLKGFLRFKKMKDFYFAKIEPTNNVLPILVNHFKKRLSNESWIIHDSKRDIYALYDTKKVVYLNKDDVINLNLKFSNDEEMYEDLWKTFFNTIGIKERENKKCQMNFMPKKYWNNIIEMENKI